MTNEQKDINISTQPFMFKGVKCVVKVNGNFFSSGTFRYAYYGEIIREDNRQKVDDIVVKVPKRHGVEISWISDLSATRKLEEIVGTFTAEVLGRVGVRKISVNPYYVLKINADLGYYLAKVQGRLREIDIWAEHKLPGFTKFNSNSGWCDNAFTSVQAFSHYSWIKSNGSYIINDIQGWYDGQGYILTDPSISSVNQAYGESDLGVIGILKFMYHHECNEFCKKFNLPDNSTRIYDAIKKYIAQLRCVKTTTFKFDIQFDAQTLAQIKKLYQDFIQKEIIEKPLYKDKGCLIS
jgi:hypothetical protein